MACMNLIEAMLKIIRSFVMLHFRDILLVNLHSQSELHFLLQYTELLRSCHVVAQCAMLDTTSVYLCGTYRYLKTEFRWPRRTFALLLLYFL
jgi:hypothetical protein